MIEENRPNLDPRPELVLTGTDGNAFSILGRCKRLLKAYDQEHGTEHAEAYEAEATAGDYDHLLQTTMRYVDVT